LYGEVVVADWCPFHGLDSDIGKAMVGKDAGSQRIDHIRSHDDTPMARVRGPGNEKSDNVNMISRSGSHSVILGTSIDRTCKKESLSAIFTLNLPDIVEQNAFDQTQLTW